MLGDVHSGFLLLACVGVFVACLIFFVLDLMTRILVFLTGVCLSAEVVLIGAYSPAQCCNDHAGMLRDVLRVFRLLVWEFLLLELFFRLFYLLPICCACCRSI